MFSASLIPDLAASGLREALAEGTVTLFVDTGRDDRLLTPPGVSSLVRSYGIRTCLGTKETVEAESMDDFFRRAGEALARKRTVVAVRRRDTVPCFESAGHICLRSVPRGLWRDMMRSMMASSQYVVGSPTAEDAVRHAVLVASAREETQRHGEADARPVGVRDEDTESMLVRRE